MKKVLITMLAFLQFLVLTAGSAYAADDHHHGRLEKLVVTDTETGRQNHYILYTYNNAGLRKNTIIPRCMIIIETGC